MEKCLLFEDGKEKGFYEFIDNLDHKDPIFNGLVISDDCLNEVKNVLDVNTMLRHFRKEDKKLFVTYEELRHVIALCIQIFLKFNKVCLPDSFDENCVCEIVGNIFHLEISLEESEKYANIFDGMSIENIDYTVINLRHLGYFQRKYGVATDPKFVRDFCNKLTVLKNSGDNESFVFGDNLSCMAVYKLTGSDFLSKYLLDGKVWKLSLELKKIPLNLKSEEIIKLFELEVSDEEIAAFGETDVTPSGFEKLLVLNRKSAIKLKQKTLEEFKTHAKTLGIALSDEQITGIWDLLSPKVAKLQQTVLESAQAETPTLQQSALEVAQTSVEPTPEKAQQSKFPKLSDLEPETSSSGLDFDIILPDGDAEPEPETQTKKELFQQDVLLPRFPLSRRQLRTVYFLIKLDVTDSRLDKLRKILNQEVDLGNREQKERIRRVIELLENTNPYHGIMGVFQRIYDLCGSIVDWLCSKEKPTFAEVLKQNREFYDKLSGNSKNLNELKQERAPGFSDNPKLQKANEFLLPNKEKYEHQKQL